MKEIWKPIKDYENYEVSNLGRVKSIERYVRVNSSFRKKKEIILNPFIEREGYLIVSLYNHKKQISRRVHRLVAQAFIPNPKNKLQINHIDGNKTYNDIRNLEWATNQENRDHAVKNKFHSFGEKNGMSFLKEKDVVDIYQNSSSYENIAKKYNIGVGQVSKIKNDRQWSHLTKNISVNKSDRRPKINEKIAIEIREKILKGVSMKSLSDLYNLHISTIYKIKNNKMWRSVI